MKPFRFGVSIWHVQSRADLVEKARKVEALGYATLTLPDHLTDRIAPVPALAVAAEATKQLRVGTNVLRFFADRAAKKWPLRGSLKLG